MAAIFIVLYLQNMDSTPFYTKVGSAEKIEKRRYSEKIRVFMRFYGVGYTPDWRGNP